MDFLPQNMLIDFAIMAALIFIGQLLRARIKWIQRLFLPPAMIAGFIGLFLGPYFLDIIPFTDVISEYPFLLIIMLFATLFLGSNEKISFRTTLNKVGDTLTLSMAGLIGQYGIGLLVGGIIIALLFPTVEPGFGLMMPAGFVGGHGSATAIGGTLKTVANWDEAVTIGQTFATAGLLIGVIGGVIMINIAIKKNVTCFIKEIGKLPKEMRTGFISNEERTSLGEATTHPMSIDGITWHLTLVLLAVALGYILNFILGYIFPSMSFPLMSLAMIGGVLLQQVLNKWGLNKYVDREVINHLGGTVTDYLVAFGIASINLNVVLDYAIPIIVLLIMGIFFTLFYTMVICRRLFHNYWFERSIFTFGWMMGVTSIGIMLLRIVDSEYKSGILEDYGMAYVFMSIAEVLIISFAPLAVVYGYGYMMGALLLVIATSLIGFTYKQYGCNKISKR